MTSGPQTVDLALLNSGSIRIDDQLQGNITSIDLFRAMPFGGEVWQVEMKGSLLEGVLSYSEEHKGTGAYLQYSGISMEYGQWKVNGAALASEQYYTVALNDFFNERI